MSLPIQDIETLEDGKVNTEEINEFLNSTLNFLFFVFSNKLLILINLFLATLVASLILYITPPSYTAISSFVCPPPEILVGSYQDLSGTSSISLGGFGSFLKDPADIYLELLKSRDINLKIIQKYNLMKELNTKEYESTFQKMSSLRELENNKGIISVIITTQNAALSADISNEYINQMSLFLSSSNVNAARNERIFLEKRLSEVHTDLTSSSKILSNFQSDKKMLDVEKQSQEIIRTIGELQSKIVEKESQIEGLKVIYTEKSPKISSLKEEISFLQIELNKIKGTEKGTGESVLGAKMVDIPRFSLDYVELVRNVKVQEVVFELLSKQFELSKLKEAKEKVNIKIIDKGKAPDKKSGPKIRSTLTLVFVLCFVLTLSYLFIKYQLNNLYKVHPETRENMKRLRIKIIGL